MKKKKFILINKKIKKFNKTIKIVPDKSLSLRALMLASQCIGISKIKNLLESEDVLDCINSLKKSLGVKIEKKNNIYYVYGNGLNSFKIKKKIIKVYVGNSGTVARLLSGLLSTHPGKFYLYGDSSMNKRDFTRVTEPLKKVGAYLFWRTHNRDISIDMFTSSIKEFTRGGAKSIATILNQMGTEEAEQYLEQIANEDAELYTEIKKYFLSFDDLLEMPDHMMKIYWRNPEIESEDLSKAVKGYDSSVVENILTYLPKRKQKMFEPFEQPLAKKEAEKAQLIFVALAKKMGENDELNLEELMQDADDMIE